MVRVFILFAALCLSLFAHAGEQTVQPVPQFGRVVAAYRSNEGYLLVEFDNEAFKNTFFWGTRQDLYQQAAGEDFSAHGTRGIESLTLRDGTEDVHFTRQGDRLVSVGSSRQIVLMPYSRVGASTLTTLFADHPPRLNLLPLCKDVLAAQ